MGRLELRLGLGLGSGPRVVGRLESKVWVNASFQIFALTAGAKVLGREGNCPGVRRGNVRGTMSEGKLSRHT